MLQTFNEMNKINILTTLSLVLLFLFWQLPTNHNFVNDQLKKHE